MNILSALRQAEAKLKKQADKARQQLDAVRAAMKILGRGTTNSAKPIGRKKWVMSAAARAKISRAQRKRWAKVNAKSD
jgi:hypothetical protein